jgi:hypothetical protein
MLMIGCNYHPGLQQIACVDTDTGELSERRLAHRERAEQFYRELKQGQRVVRVGMESSGHSRWFERLLHELGFELWTGDPAKIRSKRVRQQKTDRQDAAVAAVDVGESLSAGLGARRRESRPAATPIASTSTGADAHASDESTSCRALQ